MKINWPFNNGLYSLKNCHKQFGQAFRPPHPLYGQCPNLQGIFLGGASLRHIVQSFTKKSAKHVLLKDMHAFTNATTRYTSAIGLIVVVIIVVNILAVAFWGHGGENCGPDPY